MFWPNRVMTDYEYRCHISVCSYRNLGILLDLQLDISVLIDMMIKNRMQRPLKPRMHHVSIKNGYNDFLYCHAKEKKPYKPSQALSNFLVNSCIFIF